ncbi:Enhancer of rudimentary-like protein [Diplonema papillatum]|nr:Enhancer of rudimentary-like protein [Diplonema papillatum]
MTHAIVMYQPTSALGSRTFSDFDTLADAMNGLCHMFEIKLKQQNPGTTELTYDVADLFKFLDSFEDLSLMQFSAEKKAYEPFGLNWIKSKLYSQLKADQ